MKVILRDDIEKLGKLGDVIEVSDGYARNYLLPKQMAYTMTVDAEKRIEADKRRRLVRAQKKVEELKLAAELLNGRSVTISARAHEEHLYGSVGAEEIAKAILEEHKINVLPTSIQLEAPFRTLGTPDVKLALAPGVEAVMKVWIVAEGGKE